MNFTSSGALPDSMLAENKALGGATIGVTVGVAVAVAVAVGGELVGDKVGVAVEAAVGVNVSNGRSLGFWEMDSPQATMSRTADTAMT